MERGSLNVKNARLIDRDIVILPPFHIKLGVAKNFIKSIDKNSATFEYFHKFFPTIYAANIKVGVLVGPQIRKLLLDDGLKQVLKKAQLNTWNSIEILLKTFKSQI